MATSKESDVPMLDMDPNDVGTDVRETVANVINNHVVALNSRAVMPDGRQLSREQILVSLNLNPNTPPDAWLAIVACGSNASALNFEDMRRLAVRNMTKAATTLETLERFGATRGLGGVLFRDEPGGKPTSPGNGGYASGGSAPGAHLADPTRR